MLTSMQSNWEPAHKSRRKITSTNYDDGNSHSHYVNDNNLNAGKSLLSGQNSYFSSKKQQPENNYPELPMLKVPQSLSVGRMGHSMGSSSNQHSLSYGQQQSNMNMTNSQLNSSSSGHAGVSNSNSHMLGMLGKTMTGSLASPRSLQQGHSGQQRDYRKSRVSSRISGQSAYNYHQQRSNRRKHQQQQYGHTDNSSNLGQSYSLSSQSPSSSLGYGGQKGHPIQVDPKTTENLRPVPSNSTDKGVLPQIQLFNNSQGRVDQSQRSQQGGYPKVTNASYNNNYTLVEEHAMATSTSIKGLKPGNPNWTNQDNFFIDENFDTENTKVYCVLDGHGENGHHVSRRCREQFPLIIKTANYDMPAAFNMMQSDLNSCEYDVKCSGATCVVALLQGSKLSVYNCGDSRAVLGRRNQNGVICAHALSLDHKPDRSDERKRVLSCGGHLGCRQVLVNQPGRGPVSMPVGPCRVWYQHRGETLGLAMSRSLGDSVVHKCGVSAEPEILEHNLDVKDEFFILGTDGIWDVVDNNYAVQMVTNFINKSNSKWSTYDASQCIAKYARSRWEKLSQMVDDITCIVVKVKGDRE